MVSLCGVRAAGHFQGSAFVGLESYALQRMDAYDLRVVRFSSKPRLAPIESVGRALLLFLFFLR